VAGSSYRLPVVLVVDDDPGMRRLLRTGLELDGAEVREAASLAEARAAMVPEIRGVVLDRELPDGDGLELLIDLRDACPAAQVVVHSDLDDPLPDAALRRVDKGDVEALVDVLDLRASPAREGRIGAVDVLLDREEEVVAEWRALCRWDPVLPPDSEPRMAPAFVSIVIDAMDRPQPIGWGPDPDVERVAEQFAAVTGSIDVAIGQLVCLGEALHRTVSGHIPDGEMGETEQRIRMLIERAVGVAAHRTAVSLENEAAIDSLTGLRNRRSLGRDLDHELARCRRHGRQLTVVALDVDGLKHVNDTEGHHAGDTWLRSLAGALCDSLRAGDDAYRVGGDEFALLLPETDPGDAGALLARVAALGAPPHSWGAAGYPDDGDGGEALLRVADERLYERRRSREW
jgi:diguanylate cyclase (GGDEF)-like protein